MPKIAVTSTGGDTPRLAANALRQRLFIQNNTTSDIRWRQFGPVSATDGLIIRANGGFLNLAGDDAARAFYAIHGVAGTTLNLDYDSDV